MIAWQETSAPDLINKVENGRSTTYRKGTSGWDEYEQFKAGGGNPMPYDSLTPAKDSKLAEIKKACNLEIESIYPIWKQINISNLLSPYTEQEKAAMFTHIETQRAKCSAKESQIAQAQTVEQVQAITWG